MLNLNLLKEMATSAAGSISSPGLMGLGIAGLASAGIWSAIKDTRKVNEDILQERKINFSIPSALNKTIQANRSLVYKFSDPFQRASLAYLSGIFEMQRLSLETFRDFQHYDQNYSDKKKEDRSLKDSILDFLNKKNQELNVFSQLFSYFGKGMTPMAVRKFYGFDDEKEREKEREKQEEITKVLGIGYSQAFLFTSTEIGKKIIDSSSNHISAGLNLASAQLTATVGLYRVALTIMKTIGAEKVLGINDDVRNERTLISAIANLPSTILNLPGINALVNIGKTGFNILTFPLKIMGKIGEFFDKTRFELKDFFSGGLRSKASQKEILEAAGIKAKTSEDFWRTAGANALEGIRHYTQISALFLQKILALQEEVAGKTVDKSDVNSLIRKGPLIYDFFTGKYTENKEFYKDALTEAITKVYGESAVGKVRNVTSAIFDVLRGRSALESWEKRKKRSIKAYGGVHGARTDAELFDLLSNPEVVLPGGDIDELMEIKTKGRFRGSKDTYSKVAATWEGIKGAAKLNALVGLGLVTGGATGVLMALGGLASSIMHGGKAEDVYRKSQIEILEEDIKKMGGGELSFFKSVMKEDTTILPSSTSGGKGPTTPPNLIPSLLRSSRYILTKVYSSIKDLRDYFLKDSNPIIRHLESIKDSISENTLQSQENLETLDTIKQLLIKIYHSENPLGPVSGSKSGRVLGFQVLKTTDKDSSGTLPKFAKGGVIPGTPSSSDNATVVDDRTGKPIAKVASGEIVLPRTAIQKLAEDQKEQSYKDRLLAGIEGIREFLTGKIGYYMRDFWETFVKFKKKKEGDDSEKAGGGNLISSLFGLIPAGLGAAYLFAKKNAKKIFGGIFSFFWSSLRTLGKDFYKLILKPIGRTGVFFANLLNKYMFLPVKTFFKDKLFTPFKSVFTEKIPELFSKAFSSEGLLGRIISPIKNFFVETIPKFFGGMFKSEAGEGILKKIFPKITGVFKGIFKRLPGLNVLFGAWDAFSAWKNAEQITGDPKPGFIKKVGAGISGVLSGLLFGLIEPSTIYGFMKPVIDKMADEGIIKTISDWFMNLAPIKEIKEFLGYTENDPNPEKSFISRVWEKLKEIAADAFNYLCDVPYIGPPLRLIRDAYDYIVNLEPLENTKSFLSTMWEKVKDISKDAFSYMKKIPFFGTFFSLFGDLYDLLFGDEEKKPEKSFLMQMIDDIRNLDLDSLFSKILGPVYTGAKSLYDKLFGEGSSQKLINAGTSVVKNLKNTVSEGLATGIDKTKNVISDIANSNFVDTAKDVATKTYESAKETFTKTYESAKEVGSDVVGKVTSGISSIWEKTKEFFAGKDLSKETITVGKYKMRADVYDAIMKASRKYGVPEDYMFAMAAQESGFNPEAKAQTSSATGLFQFIRDTWRKMWGTDSVDPKDPYASADAGARYALENMKALGTTDPGALYLGHFLGTGGAKKLLQAIKKDPNTLASDVLQPNQIQANKSIIKPTTTVADLYEWASKKIGSKVNELGGGQRIELASAEIDKKVSTPPLRDQSKIAPVGEVPNLATKIEESKTPPITYEREAPQVKVGKTESPEPVLPNVNVVNNSIPPAKDPYSATYAKSVDPLFLDSFLNNLFSSSINTFTNNLGRIFVYGESMNLNFQTT